MVNGVGRRAVTDGENDRIGAQGGASLQMNHPPTSRVSRDAPDLVEEEGEFCRVAGIGRRGEQ
jgi:hypothetical protein